MNLLVNLGNQQLSRNEPSLSEHSELRTLKMKSSNPISSEHVSERWKTVEILFLVNILVNIGKIWKVSRNEPMFVSVPTPLTWPLSNYTK